MMPETKPPVNRLPDCGWHGNRFLYGRMAPKFAVWPGWLPGDPLSGVFDDYDGVPVEHDHDLIRRAENEGRL